MKGIIGLRKFIVILLVIGIASTLVIFGKITSDNYVSLVTWVTGLYFGASVGSKLADKVSVETKVSETKVSEVKV